MNVFLSGTQYQKVRCSDLCHSVHCTKYLLSYHRFDSRTPEALRPTPTHQTEKSASFLQEGSDHDCSLLEVFAAGECVIRSPPVAISNGAVYYS